MGECTFWQVVGEGAQAGASSEGGSSKFTVDLLDQFFKDPNMQQLLYKYLPEPMRNPQTFEWMLQNPEYRKQLEAMMEQQVPPGPQTFNGQNCPYTC